MKDWAVEVESISLRFVFFIAVERVVSKVSALAIFRVLMVKELIHFLVGLHSRLPLRVLQALEQIQILIVIHILDRVLVGVLLIGLIAIELLDGDVIKFVHELAAPLLLRLELSLLVEVSFANARLHNVGRFVDQVEVRGSLRVVVPHHLEIV